MKKKSNLLTTVGSLGINDVFSKPLPESLEPAPQQWRIISVEKYTPTRHTTFIVAVCVNSAGDKLRTKRFLKTDQVILLHKMIAV